MKRLRKKTYDFSRANTIVRDVLGQKTEDGGGDDATATTWESAAKRQKMDDECTTRARSRRRDRAKRSRSISRINCISRL